MGLMNWRSIQRRGPFSLVENLAHFVHCYMEFRGGGGGGG